MARDVWQKFITSRTDGRALEGAQITVNVQGGGLATIWNARSGGSQLPNPFNTGADGLARFFADPGFYEVTAFKAGEGTATFVWNNLGDNNLREDIGTMAFVDAQTSTTDTTTGRGLVVGAFGLGDPSSVPIVDPSPYGTQQPTMFARWGVAPSEFSNLGNNVSYLHINGNVDRGARLFFEPNATTPQAWLQTFGTTAASPTARLYHNRNILGTVSQSGGVPTGAIIQRGSNANGEFVRFADGTLICTRTVTVTVDITANAGGSHRSLAQVFTLPSSAGSSRRTIASGGALASNVWAISDTASQSDFRFRLMSVAEQTGVECVVDLTFISRWFTP